MLSNLRQRGKDRSKCLFLLSIDAQVFVESEADTIFWEAVFQHFAPNLKVRFYPSGGETRIRGCRRLEQMLDDDGVNEYRILCFDSDYSRYWTGNTRYNSEFILQTYTYAFDNYNTLPQRLNEIVKSVTRETDAAKINFDFNLFLLDYSKTIFPLFVYFVAKRKVEPACENPVFDTQEMLQTLDYAKIMTDLENLVNGQITNGYSNISIDDYNVIATELNDIYGINEKNTWLFVRGHDVQDKIVFALLKNITKHISKKKIQEYIAKKATDSTFEQHLQNYKNHLGFDNKKAKNATITEQQILLSESRERKINTLLNDAFRSAIIDKSCFPMQKIGRNIQNIAATHQANF